MLKGGLVYANRVVTVSPTYALEASAGGAAGFLRSTLARPDVAAKFGGVLNGIDVDMWDPRSDGLIAAPYGVGAMAGKALNKNFLQMGLGLKVDPAAPLVVCVTRLVPQKGIHLIKRAIYRTAERGGQAVLLGTGHADGEFKAMAEHDFAGSDAVKLMLTYSEPLAHALYAAADVVLVPSRSESFGLVALEAGACGVPVVANAVGGLLTLVDHGDTGFLVPDRDPDVFARHTRWLLDHPAEAQHMGERAALRARRYTWSLAAARLRRMYSDLRAGALVSCD